MGNFFWNFFSEFFLCGTFFMSIFIREKKIYIGGWLAG